MVQVANTQDGNKSGTAAAKFVFAMSSIVQRKVKNAAANGKGDLKRVGNGERTVDEFSTGCEGECRVRFKANVRVRERDQDRRKGGYKAKERVRKGGTARFCYRE